MEHDEGYDAEYYAQREETQRDLARRSSDPAVARIHTEMADSYAAKARAATARVSPAKP